ncbi:MAG: HisA/HisF-related TIM barrel protein [Alphaproteobacteria bacterium]|nr:HisA/HisF-related TIM barrel protein [Alphaproteobacteria bacterium]
MVLRLIPVLLLDRKRRLVKTVGFGERTYIGDPFNVIRIFNEKEVDEICILDIDASVDGRSPDSGFVSELASECFMPLGYGGGISSRRDAGNLFRAGVEKVILGACASDGKLIEVISRDYGSQAIVVSVDVARSGYGWEVRTFSGKKVVSDDPFEYADRMVAFGAGEILLCDIDRDGTRSGYDLELVHLMSANLSVPLIALGGAGERNHLREGLVAGAQAVASGSAFVFQGRLRAVLITYPTGEEMEEIVANMVSGR